MYRTVDSNYEYTNDDIKGKLSEIKKVGKELDLDFEKNMNNMKVLSTGDRSNRLIAEVGYPDGTVVLYYKSSKGTSGKVGGEWYPLGGFIVYPRAWFIKDGDILNRYGSNVYIETSKYLLDNEGELF